MYIAAITYTIQPEKKEELIALAHCTNTAQEALSLLMKIPGGIGYYSLLNPDANEGIALYLYATEAQANEAPNTPEYQPLITSEYARKTLNCAVPGSLTRKVYEVKGQG